MAVCDRRFLRWGILLPVIEYEEVSGSLYGPSAGKGSYGVTIRQEIAERTGREVSIGSIYTALHRLEKRGLVRAWMGEPTSERGGRRKRHYELLPAGARSLSEAYNALRRMAEGTAISLDALSEAACAAGLLPVYRATCIDPVEALRQE